MVRLIQNLKLQKYYADKFLRSLYYYGESLDKRTKISVNRVIPKGPYIDFSGESVVITDGNGSLGKSLAKKLGNFNAKVAIWGSDLEDLNETAHFAKLNNERIVAYACDMTRRDEIYRVAEKTKRDIGEVSIVINNTDVACEKLFLNSPDYVLKRAFDSNIMSHFWVTKAFLPNMIDSNKGHIISIASMAGFMGIQKLTDYSASKAAAISFLNALRVELEREGSAVKTSVICPFFVDGTCLRAKPKFRMIKALDSDQVADRIILAIKDKEAMTFIPWWLKYLIVPRWITPSFISSFVTKVLVRDACPSAETYQTSSKPLKIIQFVRKGDEGLIEIKDEESGKDLKKFK